MIHTQPPRYPSGIGHRNAFLVIGTIVHETGHVNLHTDAQ
jgi:hypothetical protein